jgi:hypothetical protein
MQFVTTELKPASKVKRAGTHEMLSVSLRYNRCPEAFSRSHAVYPIGKVHT